MDDNLHSLLVGSVAALIFMIATALFFIINEQSNQMLGSFEDVHRSDRSVSLSSKESIAYEMDGTDIIFKIYHGITCDLYVDGLFIPKGTEPNDYNYSVIDATKVYTVTNIINSEDEITQMVFESK